MARKLRTKIKSVFVKLEYLIVRIYRYVNKVDQTEIFFDTNCYRLIRRFFNDDARNVMQRIRTKELLKGYRPKLNYMVASEMFQHLADDVANINYLECREGLQLAMDHIDCKEENFGYDPDMEIYFYFSSGNLLPHDKVKQLSLFRALEQLHKQDFSRKYICQYKDACLQAGTHLFNEKTKWKEAIQKRLLQKYDPQYVDEIKIFPFDNKKRADVRKGVRKRKECGVIFRSFALGISYYFTNNYHFNFVSPLDPTAIEGIIARFKPIFVQQYRILDRFFADGYSVEKNDNDIIDFLIVCSLHQSNIFISNETAHLVPDLKKEGITNVMTWNEYVRDLRLPRYVLPRQQ